MGVSASNASAGAESFADRPNMALARVMLQPLRRKEFDAIRAMTPWSRSRCFIFSSLAMTAHLHRDGSALPRASERSGDRVPEELPDPASGGAAPGVPGLLDR